MTVDPAHKAEWLKTVMQATGQASQAGDAPTANLLQAVTLLLMGNPPESIPFRLEGAHAACWEGILRGIQAGAEGQLRAAAGAQARDGGSGMAVPPEFQEDIQHMLDLRRRVQREPRVLAEVVSALEKLLARVDQNIHASFWAALQDDLGNASGHLPTGDRGANLGRAIACYTEALTVYTPQAAPREYATTQNNLGTAYAAICRRGIGGQTWCGPSPVTRRR